MLIYVNIKFLHVADRWFHLPVLPSQAAALLWRLVGFHLTATSATWCHLDFPEKSSYAKFLLPNYSQHTTKSILKHRIGLISTSTQEPGALHCCDHVGEKIAPTPVAAVATLTDALRNVMTNMVMEKSWKKYEKLLKLKLCMPPRRWILATCPESKVARPPCRKSFHGGSFLAPALRMSCYSATLPDCLFFQAAIWIWPWTPHQIQRFIHGRLARCNLTSESTGHPLDMLCISRLQNRLPDVQLGPRIFQHSSWLLVPEIPSGMWSPPPKKKI